MAFDSVVWLTVKGVIKKNPLKNRAEEKISEREERSYSQKSRENTVVGGQKDKHRAVSYRIREWFGLEGII